MGATTLMADDGGGEKRRLVRARLVDLQKRREILEGKKRSIHLDLLFASISTNSMSR